MTKRLLKRGDAVETRRGSGYVVKVDTVSYIAPMYHVLLVEGACAGEIMYASNPWFAPELYPSAPDIPVDELYVIRAELGFSIKRNLVTGVVTCPQCATQYHEIGDTEIIDIETDEVAFYCKECGERL